MEKEFEMINKEIQIDINGYPKGLQKIMEELEEYDAKGEWVMYDGHAEGLESSAKHHLMENNITKSQYETLMKRYRSY